MKFLVGTKQHMTQVFDDDGRAHPATIVKVGPVVVTQVKTAEKDGYSAVQVGFGERKAKNIRKPQQGHAKSLGSFFGFKEYRLKEGTPESGHGDKLDVSLFEPGDLVRVSAVSKGKGFQGVVKRHGFKGGPRTHGQKHSEREPGSIGGGGRAGGRVVKGMRMAGRMGSDRVTLPHVKVLQVDAEGGQLVLRGSIPGRRGTVVEIRGV